MGNRFDDSGIFAEFKVIILLMLVAVAGGALFTLSTIDFFITSATLFANPGAFMLFGLAIFFAGAAAAAYTMLNKMDD